MNERQQNNFDFLRLAAALCVTFAHSFNYCYTRFTEPLYAASNGKINFADLGLYTFFSLSGYLIAKSAGSSKTVLAFFWKRLLRIQPLLVLVCIATVFILGTLFTTLSLQDYFTNPKTWTYFRTVFPATGIQFTLPGVFENYTETGVNGSLWTLVLEERLYLVAGVILFLPKFKKQAWILLAVLANSYFILILLDPANNFLNLHYSSFFLVLLFINGAALYLAASVFMQRYYRQMLLCMLPCLVSFLHPRLVFLQVLLLPVIIIALAQVKCFLNRTGKYGDFSYGIFVLSFPVQQMLCSLKVFRENPYLQFITTLAAVLPVAILLWHLVEKKMLSYKNYPFKQSVWFLIVFLIPLTFYRGY